MEEDFFCGQCGKVFSNKKKYKQHQLYHDESDVQCTQCDKICNGKAALKDHARTRKTTICKHCEIVIPSFNISRHSKVCKENQIL